MPRRVMFTINNPTEMDNTLLKMLTEHEQFRYMICQLEQGEQGTPHIQGYCEIMKNQDLSWFKKLLPRAHIEFCRGSSVDNIHYCSKPLTNPDGSQCTCDHCKGAVRLLGPFVYGEPAKNLSGTAYWQTVIDMIKAGAPDEEIINEYPQAAGHLKHIREYREVFESAKNKNPLVKDPRHEARKLRVIWLYGKSGIGKTQAVRHLFPNIYKVSKRDGFDKYVSEPAVLFDDFQEGQYKFETMLDYLDIWPCQLQCRYNNKWACYNDVFVLSIKLPSDIYQDVRGDEFEQFLRRVTTVEMYKDPMTGQRRFRHRKSDTEIFDYLTLGELIEKIPYRQEG